MKNSSKTQFLRKISHYGIQFGKYVKSVTTWYSAKLDFTKVSERNLNSLIADPARSNLSISDLLEANSSPDNFPLTKPSVADWLETNPEGSCLSDSIPMILKLQTSQPWISKSLKPILQSPAEPPDCNGLNIFRGPFNDYVELPDKEDLESTNAYIIKHENLSKHYFEQNDFTLGIYHFVLMLMAYPDPMERMNTEAEYLGRITLTLAKNVLADLTEMMKSQFKEDE